MDSEIQQQQLKLYKRRWYVLILYCLNGFAMNYELQLFTGVPDTTVHYYEKGNVQMSQINQSLAIGAIIYCILLFPMMFVDSKFNNFRFITLLASYMYLSATIIRLIPTFFSSQLKHAFVYITISSALIQIGGIFSYSTPSKISALWFSSKQRVIATSFASLATTLGVAVNYFASPLIVKITWFVKDKTHFQGNLPLLLYGEAIVQLILTVTMTIYFPASPKIPPSYSENFKRKINQVDQQTSINQTDDAIPLMSGQPVASYVSNDYSIQEQTLSQQVPLQTDYQPPSTSSATQTKSDSISFLKSLQIIFTSPQMIMLLLFCGLSVGGIQAYNNNVTYMMTVLDFKQSIGGLVSSFATTSAVVGAVLLPLAQKTCFKKKDKLFYLIVFIICDVVYTLLLLTMPVPESWIKKKHEYRSIIKPSLPLIFITTIFAGIFVGMSYPLFFETAAEISFPVNEIVSGASITLATTVTYFVALLTFSAVKAEYTTLVALCLCVLGSILIPFLKVSYKRSEMEDLEREKELEQKQIQESQRGQKSKYGYSQAKIDE